MTLPDFTDPATILRELQPYCGGGKNGFCQEPATFVASIHMVDNCTKGQHLTLDGGTIHFRCRSCLADLAKLMGDELQRRLGKLPNGVSFYACGTCARPISSLHDLLDTEVL